MIKVPIQMNPETYINRLESRLAVVEPDSPALVDTVVESSPTQPIMAYVPNEGRESFYLVVLAIIVVVLVFLYLMETRRKGG